MNPYQANKAAYNQVFVCNHSGDWKDCDNNTVPGPQCGEVCVLIDQLIVNGTSYFMLKGYSVIDDQYNYNWYLSEDFIDPILWRSEITFPIKSSIIGDLLLSYMKLDMERSFT